MSFEKLQEEVEIIRPQLDGISRKIKQYESYLTVFPDFSKDYEGIGCIQWKHGRLRVNERPLIELKAFPRIEAFTLLDDFFKSMLIHVRDLRLTLHSEKE